LLGIRTNSTSPVRKGPDWGRKEITLDMEKRTVRVERVMIDTAQPPFRDHLQLGGYPGNQRNGRGREKGLKKNCFIQKRSNLLFKKRNKLTWAIRGRVPMVFGRLLLEKLWGGKKGTKSERFGEKRHRHNREWLGLFVAPRRGKKV